MKNWKVRGVVNATQNYSFVECINDMINIDNNEHSLNILGKDMCRLSCNYITRFFCGQDQIICNWSNLTDVSFNRAINNLNKYFSMIGLTEQYELSLKLFYSKFRNFFKPETTYDKLKNVLIKIKKQQDYGIVGHSNIDKQSVQYKYLADKNNLDIKLYSYVRYYFYKYIVDLT